MILPGRPQLYELFAVAKPRLAGGQRALVEIMKAVGTQIQAANGVITDIKYYGERPLAYDIRQPGARYSEVRAGHQQWSRACVGRPRRRQARRRAAPASAACSSRLPATAAVAAHPPARACSRSTPPSLLPSPCAPPQANMWQINFAASPKTLEEVHHTLRVDERMLRWLVVKRRPYDPLPSTVQVGTRPERCAAVPLRVAAAAAGGCGELPLTTCRVLHPAWCCTMYFHPPNRCPPPSPLQVARAVEKVAVPLAKQEQLAAGGAAS